MSLRAAVVHLERREACGQRIVPCARRCRSFGSQEQVDAQPVEARGEPALQLGRRIGQQLREHGRAPSLRRGVGAHRVERPVRRRDLLGVRRHARGAQPRFVERSRQHQGRQAAADRLHRGHRRDGERREEGRRRRCALHEAEARHGVGKARLDERALVGEVATIDRELLGERRQRARRCRVRGRRDAGAGAVDHADEQHGGHERQRAQGRRREAGRLHDERARDVGERVERDDHAGDPLAVAGGHERCALLAHPDEQRRERRRERERGARHRERRLAVREGEQGGEITRQREGRGGTGARRRRRVARPEQHDRRRGRGLDGLVVREEQHVGGLEPVGQARRQLVGEQERQRAEQHGHRHAHDEEEGGLQLGRARAGEPAPHRAIDEREPRGHGRIGVVEDRPEARGEDRRAEREQRAERDERERRVEREHEPSAQRQRAGRREKVDAAHARRRVVGASLHECHGAGFRHHVAEGDARLHEEQGRDDERQREWNAVRIRRQHAREEREADPAGGLGQRERAPAAQRMRELPAVEGHDEAHARLDQHDEPRGGEAPRSGVHEPGQQHRREHRHARGGEAQAIEGLQCMRFQRRHEQRMGRFVWSAGADSDRCCR